MKGWCAIFDALRDNPDNKIQSWDLSGQTINPEIARALAGHVSTSKALVSLKYASSHPHLCCQCHLKPCRVPHYSLHDNRLYPEGAKRVADALTANSTLTELKYAPWHPSLTVKTR